MNTNTKKLAAGASAGVLALALLGGGTFALWSDFDTVEGNQLSAGTLELELTDRSGSAVTPISMDNLAPGENRSQDFIIANRGDDTDALDGALVTVTLEDLVGKEDGCSSNSEIGVDADCNNAESGGEFATESNIQFAYGPRSADGECSYQIRQNFELAGAEDEVIQLGNIDSDEAVCLRIEAGLPSGLGPNGDGGDGNDGIDFGPNTDSTNASQGDSATFDLRFDLKQVIPNP